MRHVSVSSVTEVNSAPSGGEREVGLGRHPGRGPAGSSSERGSGEIDGPFLGPPGISKMWVCPVSHELEVHRRDAACLAVF